MKELSDFLGLLTLSAVIFSLYTKLVHSVPQIVINIGVPGIAALMMYGAYKGIIGYVGEKKKREVRKEKSRPSK